MSAATANRDYKYSTEHVRNDDLATGSFLRTSMFGVLTAVWVVGLGLGFGTLFEIPAKVHVIQVVAESFMSHVEAKPARAEAAPKPASVQAAPQAAAKPVDTQGATKPTTTEPTAKPADTQAAPQPAAARPTAPQAATRPSPTPETPKPFDVRPLEIVFEKQRPAGASILQDKERLTCFDDEGFWVTGRVAFSGYAPKYTGPAEDGPRMHITGRPVDGRPDEVITFSPGLEQARDNNQELKAGQGRIMYVPASFLGRDMVWTLTITHPQDQTPDNHVLENVMLPACKS